MHGTSDEPALTSNAASSGEPPGEQSRMVRAGQSGADGPGGASASTTDTGLRSMTRKAPRGGEEAPLVTVREHKFTTGLLPRYSGGIGEQRSFWCVVVSEDVLLAGHW